MRLSQKQMIPTLIDFTSPGSAASTAQWEFGQPTLTPIYLEDKTKVKVD